MRLLRVPLLGLLLFAWPRSARADLDLARALQAIARDRGQSAVATPLPRAFLGSAKRAPVLLERDPATVNLPASAVPIDGQWFAVELSSEEASLLARSHPGLRLHWSPPRHLLLDRAIEWAKTPEFRGRGGGEGRGVAVALIDTGVDTTHPDLRNLDGSTRVRWLIDFTRAAAGLQPDLEASFGCSGGTSCAIYSAADIDHLLANGVDGDEPRDPLGHGTHVASLAAGNGAASAPPRFVGVAPAADLIVARVTGGDTGISDPVILKAVRFVFERAADLGEPCVANLSLGSDFGAHDGSSALERALAGFVGSEHPGRAIVVAAGNSGVLYSGVAPGYPEPFGVHTEVQVPRRSPTRVPILIPSERKNTVHSRIIVWLSSRPGDQLSIAFERKGHLLGSAVAPGQARDETIDGVQLTVLNGFGVEDDQPWRGNASMIVAEADWIAGEALGLELSGYGTASLWVGGEGDLDPSISIGPLFPLAIKEGTINVPAAAAELIAVGATLNRTDWVDFEGDPITMSQNGALADSPPDTMAFFSSAGPNALGVLKPDIVAPGANVVGAMSRAADPRLSSRSGMFSGAGLCESNRECLVVDDAHAVGSGTSMAAPIVSGAIALLFERDPSLTQAGARRLLQAGARQLSGVVLNEQQVGVGALDLDGSLSAQIADDTPLSVLPGAASWLAFAASYAHPDPEWPLEGFAELRDDAGRLADGFDVRRLSGSVEGASWVQPLSRIAPGMYGFAVVAPAGSGGGTLRVALEFDGHLLVERQVPIAVDHGAGTGLPAARGGCAFSPRPRSQRWAQPLGTALWILLGALLIWRGGGRGARERS